MKQARKVNLAQRFNWRARCVEEWHVRTRRDARRGRRALLALLVLAGGVRFADPPAARAAVRPDVQFDGGGWGHGLGMSQWGARGLAANGWTYDRILAHYYRETSLAPAGSPDVIRVGLTWDVSRIDGSTSAGANASCAAGGGTALAAGSFSFVAKPDGRGQLNRSDGTEAWACSGPITITYAPGTLTTAGHNYRYGPLELSVKPGSQLVRSVLVIGAQGGVPAVDMYLRGLGEMPSSWPMEALKAQAVAGRTYALEKIDRTGQYRTSPACACGVVATVGDQAYVGYDKEAGPSGSRWVEAVDTTRLQVSTYRGAMIQAYYHSSSGGGTENNEVVWGGTPLAYLRGVADPYDGTGGNPNFQWATTMSWAELERKLNDRDATRVGQLSSISIVEPRGVSGRVSVVTSSTSGGVRIVGSAGTKRVSGDTLRWVLGLKSTLFRISNVSPPDDKTEPAGGYTLLSDGTLRPFGSAPAATGLTPLSAQVARAVAIGPRSRAGYVLDGYGGVRPFNGATPVTANASWPGWDIARDLVLRPDGTSGYLLDGYGGIHTVGSAPAVSGGPYWANQDVARRLVLRRDGVSGYVLRSDGLVAPFGGAPAVTSPTLASGRTAVGITLAPDGSSGLVVLDDGTTRAFGAGSLPPAAPGALSGSVSADGRLDGASGYSVSSTGQVAAFGDATPASATTGGLARRDIALIAEPAGYVLDGYGGMHPFGGAPDPIGTGYWSGWDIARRVLVRSDGRGYVLDGYGGMHPFGVTGVGPPAGPSGGPYFGFDIAQDAVLLPGQDSAGYVLDGWGGLHAFGGAPPARGTGYWSGWNIARALAINPEGTGGYVLDGYGGLHPFAVGDHPLPTVPPRAAYWGWDVARGLAIVGSGAGYTFDAYGGAHPFGTASGGGSWYWANHDLVAGAEAATNGWAVYLDRWGGLHTAPADAPAVAPSSVWPGWSIARDLGIVPR